MLAINQTHEFQLSGRPQSDFWFWISCRVWVTRVTQNDFQADLKREQSQAGLTFKSLYVLCNHVLNVAIFQTKNPSSVQYAKEFEVMNNWFTNNVQLRRMLLKHVINIMWLPANYILS